MSAVTILIADDHELVRKGLISLLVKNHPEWQIVAEAATGQTAVEFGVAFRPTVAILDLSMPDSGGLEVAELLIAAVPGIKILVLTMYSAAPIFRQLQKAGVRAYVVKNEAPQMLVKAVERVLAGEPFFVSGSRIAPPNLETPVQLLLTPREIEVLRLLAEGKSNKEVAGDLALSVRTVESHHASIRAKLNVESLGDLVRLALRDGVLTLRGGA